MPSPRHIAVVLAAVVAGACASAGASRGSASSTPHSPERERRAEPRPDDVDRIVDVDDSCLEAPKSTEPVGCSAIEPRPKRRKKAEPTLPDTTAALPDNVVDRIYFSENEATLDDRAALDAFAQLALDNTEVELVLVARADTRERNPEALSSRRASVVHSYLLARGVPKARIRSRAIGSEQPRAASTSDDGAANRCVELAAESR